MSKRAVKHPGRTRHIAGWVILTVLLLISGVWAVSGWNEAFYQGPRRSIYLGRGWLVVVNYHKPLFYVPYDGWGWQVREVADPDPRFHWTVADDGQAMFAPLPDSWKLGVVDYENDPAHYNRFRLCLWPLALPGAGAIVVVLWRGSVARRVAKFGLCAGCGYDKRGLASGAICPECGT